MLVEGVSHISGEENTKKGGKRQTTFGLSQRKGMLVPAVISVHSSIQDWNKL